MYYLLIIKLQGIHRLDATVITRIDTRKMVGLVRWLRRIVCTLVLERPSLSFSRTVLPDLHSDASFFSLMWRGYRYSQSQWIVGRIERSLSRNMLATKRALDFTATNDTRIAHLETKLYFNYNYIMKLGIQGIIIYTREIRTSEYIHCSSAGPYSIFIYPEEKYHNQVVLFVAVI